MDFTLEDVGSEYMKQDAHVRVALERGPSPNEYHVHATSYDLGPLEAMKTLYIGLEIVGEDLSDEEKEELSAWLAGYGD